MEPGHAAYQQNIYGHKKCREIQPWEVLVARLCYISEQALSFKIISLQFLRLFELAWGLHSLLCENFWLIDLHTCTSCALEPSTNLFLLSGGWGGILLFMQVFVMTPQIMLQNLHHCFMRMDCIEVLIFDECHHAGGRHPYACIMRVRFLKCHCVYCVYVTCSY